MKYNIELYVKLITVLICFLFISCDFTSSLQNCKDANIYADRGEYKKAIKELNKAINKKENNRRALFNRALFKTHINDTEGAIEDYKNILNFTNCTLCTFELANISFNQKKYNEAIDYLNSALQTKGVVKNDNIFIPNNQLFSDDNDSDYNVKEQEIYFTRGFSYLKNKQFVNAIKDFKKTNEFNFYKHQGYYYIAQAYLGLKDSLNACENYKKSKELGYIEDKEMLNKYCNNK